MSTAVSWPEGRKYPPLQWKQPLNCWTRWQSSVQRNIEFTDMWICIHQFQVVRCLSSNCQLPFCVLWDVGRSILCSCVFLPKLLVLVLVEIRFVNTPKSTGNTNTCLQTVLQYFVNTENVIGNTEYCNKVCSVNNPVNTRPTMAWQLPNHAHWWLTAENAIRNDQKLGIN